MSNIQELADKIVNSNLTTLEKVKQLCSLLIAVPYKRIGSLDPEDMIREGKGSCTPKHIFLAQQLQKIGVSIKFLIIPFYYKKIPLQYLTRDLDTVNAMPISYHIALKANLDGKWLILDVTWDKDLKGFPLNTKWDGISDMGLAVVPESIFEKEIDPRTFEKQKMKEYTSQEIQARRKFYKIFDELLDRSRLK